MKLRQFMNSNFFPSLDKLANSDIPIKTAFKIKKLIKDINEKHKHFEELRIKILDKYIEKDDDGKIVTNESGHGKIKEDVDKSILDKELEELLNLEEQTDTISVEEVGLIGLTPADLIALDEILVE